MTAQKSTLFNDYQQQALSALGLSLWQPKAESDAHSGNNAFCYRFGDWLILSNTRIETVQQCWSNDFLATLVELSGLSSDQLAEVSFASSDNWDDALVLDIRSQTDGQAQLAQQKRALWQQISQLLNH